MNYLEFLTKKAEAAKVKQNEQKTDTSATKETESKDLVTLFGEEFTAIEKEDGSSVFNLASKEQLADIDYEKIVSKDEPEESNSLTSVLRDFFSFDEVKKEADTDGNGEISAEEAKAYITNLSAQDGDENTLSMDDFDAVIEAKGIDLQAAAEQLLSQATGAVPETQSVPEEDASSTPDISASTPATDTSYNDNYSNYGNGSYSDYSGGSSYSSTPTNPLDSMSLEQLESEKATRQATVKEKQNDVNAVNNGSNEKVKAAKDEMKKAEDDYKNAVKNDPNVSKKTNKEFEKNLEKINENKTKLDENAVKINDKEVEIDDQEESIKSLTAESEALNSEFEGFNKQLSNLQNSLSNVGTPTGKPEDADKDAQINSKKKEINEKIAAKNKEIKDKKKEIESKDKEIKEANKKLDKLKKELENLNKDKSKLEETKAKLEEEKAAIENKIKETCSADTKAKMDAYNAAVKKVETVKASELESAKAALTEAQTAVKEVNTKINEVKNRKLFDGELNVENIPAEYRNQISVKTLPNGQKVLTFGYTNYKDLKPEMQDQIAVFNEVAAEKGYTFVMSDGFRSIAESNAARARKGNLVAPGGQSPHNYGAAFDCGVYKKGGQGLSRDEWTAFTREVQRRTNNITWGGDFKNKSCEVWHFELTDWRKYKTA